MTPKELKSSILQLAIQGKLVEQRPEEGTAEELYKQIQEEKQRLIAEKKIKKEKPLPEITEDEKPFDIPDNWKWVRLNDLSAACENPFADGPFGSNLKSEHYTKKKEVRIVQLSNIGEKGWKNKNVRYTTFEHLKTIKRSEISVGDIVIAKMMPAGRAIIIPDIEDKYVLSSDAVKFVPNPILSKIYLYYAINSFMFKKQVYSEVQGITRVRTSLQKIKKYIIPLPPLAEQKRIVEKLEQIFPHIEQYEKAWNNLEKLNKRFPDDMKKSLLQYAIQGKLVEQQPEEGIAEELYKQIQEEKQRLIAEKKIKKEKPLPEITEDEKPFDIPDNWKWVRLGEVIKLLSGKDMITSEYNENEKGIPYITGASNVIETKLIINRWTEYAKAIAHKGDLLLTCKGTVGKTLILKDEMVHIARQLMAITSYGVDIEFIKYFVDTRITYLKSQAKSMIPGIERKNILLLPFPLPPLAEQKRIVEKLEQLLPLCERLK